MVESSADFGASSPTVPSARVTPTNATHSENKATQMAVSERTEPLRLSLSTDPNLGK
jgi:hypothetical protein